LYFKTLFVLHPLDTCTNILFPWHSQLLSPKVLILDEADTLLSSGFSESIYQILSLLPKQRRTGLFSATQTKEVRDLAKAGLRNPLSISVRVQQPPQPQQPQGQGLGQAASEEGPTTKATSSSSSSLTAPATATAAKPVLQQATPSTLENYFTVCNYDDRPAELLNFLVAQQDKKSIVFCATCACVDFYSTVFERMAKKGKVLPSTVSVVGFHGKMVPKKRKGLYRKFVNLSTGVMFSTDVAARGVDIPDVDWIVQLAAPKDPAFFVHRVGRTARAGKSGGALLFVSSEEQVQNKLSPFMNPKRLNISEN
jgi:ATP-dependent RNA helicase DDX55/SPB4